MTKSSSCTPLIGFLQSFGLYFHQIPDSLSNFAAETKEIRRKGKNVSLNNQITKKTKQNKPRKLW